MSLRLIVAIVSLVVAASATPAEPLQALSAGSYPVGFSSVTIYDPTRREVERPTAQRRVQAYWWYPARDQSRPVRYADYVDLMRDESANDGDPWTAFADWTTMLGGDNDSELLRSRLASLSTMAYANAPPADGVFPLLVFPGRPAATSALAEAIASYGFVVASFPLRGSRSEALRWWSASAMEAIADDAAQVAIELQRLPYVERGPWSFMGLGLAGSAGLLGTLNDLPIDALISLDGGIPTAGESRIIERATHFAIGRATTPMLLIHAPHPHVDITLADRYRYSDRTYAHFPKMSEFHFLNFGLLEDAVPNILGPPPGNTRQGLQTAVTLVRHYLQSRRAQGELVIENFDADVVQISMHPAIEPPPALEQLISVQRRDGVVAIVELRAKLANHDPQPFTRSDYRVLLRETGDSEPDQRALLQIYVADYPNSTHALLSLAQLEKASNRPERVKEYLLAAKSALAVDGDPDLNGSRRGHYLEAIQSLQSELR